MTSSSAKKSWVILSLPGMVSIAMAAGPLDPWAERYVGATSLRDVAYGAGLFVAVGDTCYTSTNGICWTGRPLDTPAQNGLSGVAYGNGRFVAVEPSPAGRPGSAYVSTDGFSWRRSADLPGSKLPVIERIFFGGGTFLAVGQEGNPSSASGFHWLVMTSADGVTWSRQSGPTNNGDYHYLNTAAYGNGLYLAAGRSGLVLASKDLTSWTVVTGFPSSNSVEALAYGKGNFVAVTHASSPVGEDAEPFMATSSDGLHWTNRSSGLRGIVHGLTFGGNHFVAVGEPHFLASSSDAITWTMHPATVDAFMSAAYGNGSFVAAGSFFTDLPRAMAAQSGGGPQICLEALGFGPVWSPGFRLLLTAEAGRTYQIQASSLLPPVSWSNVGSLMIGPGYPGPAPWVDSQAPSSGKRFYRVISTTP